MEIGSATELARQIDQRGLLTPNGNRIDIGTDAISVRMRIDGLAALARELLQSPEEKDAAA